ncbi:MAG: lipase family protein [Candidatus Eremiobacteraeota bacterium]|nr:lipase family protein [Candidatus Eremiobacteraeota bacterium]
MSLILVAITAGPNGDAFYLPPSPLPAATHGDLIWARPWTSGLAPKSAASNTLVLYHTTSLTGVDTAISGTVSIPKGEPPKGGWPVISWAHGTTGNGPQCAPSRMDLHDTEQSALDGWLSKGYAVLQTDYEGNGTPGIHPYLVGEAAARDVTDIVRAARQLDPHIGTRWMVLGHSEGGASSLATASYGPAWAPELQLLGSIAYAPASHMFGYLYDMQSAQQPLPNVAFFFLMVRGAAAVDPDIDLHKMFYPTLTDRLPELQKRCIWELDKDFGWNSIVPAELFRRDANLDELKRVFAANEPGALAISVPVYVFQGLKDQMVGAKATTQMVAVLCARRVNMSYATYADTDHFAVMAKSQALAEGWVADRFAGRPARSRCADPPLAF